MTSSIRIKNICELPIISGSRNDTRKKISCITIDQREAEEQFSSDIHLDAFIILLVFPEITIKKAKDDRIEKCN